MNGENHQNKTPLGKFKVTTPENPLLLKQAITSKGIPVPYTNLQLNPYLNTQLDLFCSDNLSFSMHDSQYVTNQFDARIPVRHLLTKLRKMLTAKFFSSSTRWRSWNFLVAKPYSVQTQQFLQEKNELGHMFPVAICLWKTIALRCINCDGP